MNVSPAGYQSQVIKILAAATKSGTLGVCTSSFLRDASNVEWGQGLLQMWTTSLSALYFSRPLLLLLLLSRFSHVGLCATPQTAAHQVPPSLGFSRQEHWSGLPFPSPMHESEKWKWSHSVVSDPQQPHGLQPSRLLRPWDFPGKSNGVGCHCLQNKKVRVY